MRWSPRTRPSGSPASRRRDPDLARARPRDRALRSISDTPRLDAELLMAAALGIDRDRLLLDAARRRRPGALLRLLERRLAGEPVAYITGRRAFWTIDLEVGPGRADPAPRQRNPDRRGGRAFRRHARPAADPRSRHRAGHACCSPRSTCGPRRPASAIDRSEARARLCRGAMPSGSGSPTAPNFGSATGPTASPSASTWSCATRPMSPTTARARPGRRRA